MKSVAELLLLMIDSDTYTFGGFMCYALESAYEDKLISLEEDEFARRAITTFMIEVNTKWPVYMIEDQDSCGSFAALIRRAIEKRYDVSLMSTVYSEIDSFLVQLYKNWDSRQALITSFMNEAAPNFLSKYLCK